MQCCYAIIPDDSTLDTPAIPIAMFESIEDAMDWGLRRYQGGSFRVRYQRFVIVKTDEPGTASA